MRYVEDESLFERLVAGDQECLRPLMERHGDALILYVNGYVRDIDAAEDLMIEAFSRMLAKRPRLRANGFKPYLYKTARNLIPPICWVYAISASSLPAPGAPGTISGTTR